MTKVIEEDSFHEVHLVVLFQQNIRELTEKKFIDDSNLSRVIPAVVVKEIEIP